MLRLSLGAMIALLVPAQMKCSEDPKPVTIPAAARVVAPAATKTFEDDELGLSFDVPGQWEVVKDRDQDHRIAWLNKLRPRADGTHASIRREVGRVVPENQWAGLAAKAAAAHEARMHTLGGKVIVNRQMSVAGTTGLLMESDEVGPMASQIKRLSVYFHLRGVCYEVNVYTNPAGMADLKPAMMAWIESIKPLPQAGTK